MFEWFISFRYLRARHKQKFISLISLISVAGITMGVMALIVVLAVYSGFTNGLRDQILGINSHIIVQRLGGIIPEYTLVRDRIITVDDVTGATPYLYAQTLLSGPRGGTGVVLRGIAPATATGVIALPEQMVEALRQQGLPVWYMNAMNEGHGYRKKENRDIYQQAMVLFFRQYLVGDE